MRFLLACSAVVWVFNGAAAIAQPSEAPAEVVIASDKPGGDLRPLNLSAATVYTNYFHRPGATIDEHDRSLAACYSLAVAMDEPFIGGPGVDPAMIPGAYSAGGAIGMLVVGAIQDAAAERAAEAREALARAANVENCMVAFGWDVRGVASEDEARLRALPAEALRSELAALVGASEPAGELLRTFQNELAEPNGAYFGVASGVDRPSLSLMTLPAQGDTGNGARMGYRDARNVRASWVRVMDGMGVIALRIRGGPAHRGQGIRFVRMNEEGTRPASDGQPNSIGIQAPFGVDAEGFDEVAYFEAPPGNWRLAEVITGSGALSFCLAAPQFTLAEGEGVFAGTIDMRESLLPDIGSAENPPIESVREIDLRPADYIQGGQFRCAGAYFYALRLPEQ